MPRHTDSEIEQAAERFWQLADALDPATAQVERAGEVDGLIGPAAPSLALPTRRAIRGRWQHSDGYHECRGTQRDQQRKARTP